MVMPPRLGPVQVDHHIYGKGGFIRRVRKNSILRRTEI